ncbi:MAG: putative Aqualysin 1 [Nitrosopumilales archaeon]|nr:MAG: putative Aqualysin 1 [Nitrosopumilales archaeon]
MKDHLINKIILLVGIIAVLGVASSSVVLSSPASAQKGPEFIPGRFIIVLQDGVSPQDVIRGYGVVPDFVYSHALNGFSAPISATLLKDLTQDSRIKFIEQDQRVYAFDQTIPTGINRIDADIGAAKSGDGSGTVIVDIAIIDTGIDLNHPDLNVVNDVSFVGTSSGDDDNGHGSHVAGTAAALDDAVGVVGVAPGARLWAVKVLDSGGGGTLSGVIKGIDYVTSHAGEIEVANLSLGCKCKTRAGDIAINNSVSAGVTYSVAAGNSASNAKAFWPASNNKVITVSAIVDTDGKCGGLGSSTSYGADDSFATFSNFGNSVNLAAPGVDILSTDKNGGYTTKSGTSMASPHVAGAAAIYKFNNPSASPSDVQNALISFGVEQSAQCNVLLNDGNGGYTDEDGSSSEPLVYLAQGTPPVTTPDFSLSVDPTSLTLKVDETGTSTITVSSLNGYEDTVSLSATAPDTSGLILTVNPTSVTLTSTTISAASTLSVIAGSATGTFDVTVTGTGSGITHSTTVTVKVTSTSEANTVSVSSITYATEGGKNKDKHLLITVALEDDLSNPVSGASVSIDLSRDGSFVGSGTGTTGTDGTVTFSLKNAKSGCYTTTVTDVTASGLTWDGTTPLTDPFCK